METKQYAEELNLGKYWLILKHHWLPASAVFTVVVVLAAILAALQKPTYEAEGKLLFKKRDTAISLLTQGEQGGPKVGELEALNALNTPLDTEAEVIRTTPLIAETIRRLNLKDKQGNPLQSEAVLKNLTTKGIKGADVLLVAYKGSDSQEVAAVVNALMSAYIENNVLINRTEATAAREFITQQLPKTEANLRQAERNLRNFKEENTVIALKDEATEAVKSLADLDNQIAKAQTQLADATAQSVALQEKIGLSPQNAIPLNALSQSPGVQQVLDEYQKVETQLAAQLGRYTQDSPSVISLQQKKATLKALLQERVGQVVGQQQLADGNLQLDKLKQTLVADLVKSEVTRQGVANQLLTLSRTRSTYLQRASTLPRLQQVQEDLERQVETAKSNYDVLIKRLQEVQIAENQNVGNARIVSPAIVPEKPTASKKKLVLAGGVVAGGLLYIITAFLLSLRDPSLKTVKDVRELFRYTLLGLIPSLHKKGFAFSPRQPEPSIPELPVRDQPYSLVSESYRMLQANLRFISPDRALKSIVVTSSVSKEGKSTVSANLAVAMAQLDRRVLLIDADLRYPVQHHIWGLVNAVGLSDVIVGQAQVTSAIVEVMPNLEVLPSGAVPPNSLALIDSKRMHSLLNDFTHDYDFVIIDTPPLVLVADALTLGKMTDGVVLITRPGVIDTASATAAKELLVQSKQTVLGLVVNGVSMDHEPDGYFQHAKSYYKDTTASSAPMAELVKF